MRLGSGWLVRMLSAAILASALGTTVFSCGGDAASQSAPAQIRLAQNPWSGSRVDAAVAAALLRNELGYRVEIEPVDEYAQWDSIASGALHACLEVWPSGHAADIAKYIATDHTVQNAGPLGVVGKIGWYVPAYVVAQHPELVTWNGFVTPEAAALFQTPASGGKGQFLAGDPSWVQFDAQIIENLGLDFAVVFAGSEAALLAQVADAYREQVPLLFYYWRPHAAHRLYDLVEVQLPPYSPECYARAATGGIDCDYPTDTLFKIVWPGLAALAPQAYQFLTRFHWSTDQQTELLAAVDLDGMTPDEAARRWIATHEDVWREWLGARDESPALPGNREITSWP